MLRIYLIGAGVIARAHAAGAHLLGEPIELHVFDPSPASVEAFRKAEPHAIVHGSLEDMLAPPAQADDIVIVATPPATHAALAKQAFATGRHVLSEKPLAITLTEAQSMLAAAKAAGKHLGDSSMRFLGYGAGDFVREALARDEFGPLYHITCRHRAVRNRSGIEYQPDSRWFLDKSKSGGGVLMDWSVYDLATLFDAIRPQAVTIHSAWTAQPKTKNDPQGIVFDVDTHVGAAMSATLANGQIVPISYERSSATHGSPSALMEIEGTTGAVNWEWIPWLNTRTAAIVRKDMGATVEDEPHVFPNEHTLNIHHRPLHYFLALIRGKTAPIIADDRAVFNFGVIQGIYQVAQSGKPLTVV